MREIAWTLKGVTDGAVRTSGSTLAVDSLTLSTERRAQEYAPMSTASRASERGMALALAIFALVVVGALVAGAFLAGHLEQRTGRSTLYAEQAADAAEAGAAETLASWDALDLNALAPGTTAAFPTVPLAGRSAYRPTVSRLNGQIFLVQSLGTQGRVPAETPWPGARLASWLDSRRSAPVPRRHSPSASRSRSRAIRWS